MKNSRAGQIAALTSIIICLVLLMALPALTYSGILKSKTASGELRGTLSYLRSQVKSHDKSGCVEIRNGGELLVLKDVDGEYVYELRIYSRNGMLCEEYALEGMKTIEGNVTEMSPSESFRAEYVSEGLLKLSAGSGSILIDLYAAAEGSSL